MSNSPQFLQAASVVKKLNSDPSKADELEQLYGFYKQATVGDVNIENQVLNIKGVKKWETWNQCTKGKTT